MSHFATSPRCLLSILLATACGVGCALVIPSAAAQIITAVLHSPLRVLDPIVTTAYISRDHGYMIFDTLLVTDGSGKIQPQMAEKYVVSADGPVLCASGISHRTIWRDGAMA